MSGSGARPSIEDLMSGRATPPPAGTSLAYRPPIEEVMGKRPSIEQLMGGQATAPTDASWMLPREVPAQPGSESPGVLGYLFNFAKQTGQDLVQAFKYGINSPMGPMGSGMTPFNPNTPLSKDLAAADQGDPDAQERIARAQRGGAMVLTAPISTALAGPGSALVSRLGGGMLARAGTFLGTEALSGAGYGAVAPLEDNQTRLQSIEQSAIQFPIFGAALHGAAGALKFGLGGILRGFDLVKPETKQVLQSLDPAAAKDVAQRTETVFSGMGDIPEAKVPEAQAAAVEQAVTEHEQFGGHTPEAIDEVRAQAQKLVDEANPQDLPQIYKHASDLVASGDAPLAQAIKDYMEAQDPSLAGSLKENLGTMSEEELQQALKDATPAPLPPGAPVDEAAARVEAARTEPFPEIPGVPSPGTAVPEEPPPVVPPPGAREAPPALPTSPLVEAYAKETGQTVQDIVKNFKNSFPLEQNAIIRDIAGAAAGRTGVIGETAPLADVALELRRLAGEVPPAAPTPVPLIPEPGSAEARAPIPRGANAYGQGWATTPEGSYVKGDFEIKKLAAEDKVRKGDKWGLYHKGVLGETFSSLRDATTAESTPFLRQHAIGKALFNSILQAGKDAGAKITKGMADAWATGDRAKIEAEYLKNASGNKTRAYQKLADHQKILADAGVDIPSGITKPTLEETIVQAAASPGPLADAAVKDAAMDEAVAQTPPTDLMSPDVKVEAQAAVENPTPPEAVIDDTTPPQAERVGPNSGPDGYTSPVEQPLGGLRDNANPTGPPIKESHGGVPNAQLDQLVERTKNFWESEEGALSRQAASRLAVGAMSGVSFYSADQTDDPTAKAILNTLGGLLAVSALMPTGAARTWLEKNKYTYQLVKAADFARIMTSGTEQALKDYHQIVQQSKVQASQLGDKLFPFFRDKLNQRFSMMSIDEGPHAPEWSLLNADQQRETAGAAALANLAGQRLVAEGIVKNARADFIEHLFKDGDTRTLWRRQWEQLQAANPAAASTFATLREAVNWAAQHGKEEPFLDVNKAIPQYLVRAEKAIATSKMFDGFERVGQLRPYDSGVILTQGNVDPKYRLRQVMIQRGGMVMATDEVATILERVTFAKTDQEWLRALDAAKTNLMRKIMYFPWEHGINVWRGAMALDGTGAMYREAYKKIDRADPEFMQAAKYFDPLNRPDFGHEGQALFDKLLTKLSTNSPTLQKLQMGYDNWQAAAERKLWNRQVPALGFAVWGKEMKAWAERTGGRYGIGSPEYEAAAYRAGEMANTAMGKIPELMQDPKLAQIARLAFFSPNWTRSRIALTMNAMGEFQKIITGEINPGEARYLQYKLRSVMIGVVGTSIASLIFTGKLPTFNPNTMKFYANTGVKDQNGREMAVDVTGWWQDDLKLFNDPFVYLRDRANPMLREVGTQVMGRDVFGRSISGTGERLASALKMFGPPGEMAGFVAGGLTRTLQGDQAKPYTTADFMKDASNMAAVGNVSALPMESDVLIAKYAGKILRMSGLPDDKDRVQELGKLMKRNITQGGSGIEGEVPTYLANQRRSYGTKPIPWLWQESKQVLKNLSR